MKSTKKDAHWITIDGVELGSDHAQFLPCRGQVPEEPPEAIPEMREILGGGAFLPCLQCGTCVATCALSSLMDHPPRKFLLALALGQAEEALASNTLWLCLSCYQCTSRCPRGVKITDVIAALREAVVRAQARQEEEALQEAYYAAIRQDQAGQGSDFSSKLEAQSSKPPAVSRKLSDVEDLLPPRKEPQGKELRQQALEELRRLHLEAKEQLFRYRKMVQKARRSGKPQEALAHFDTLLARYCGTPWYEEMRRIRDELLINQLIAHSS